MKPRLLPSAFFNTLSAKEKGQKHYLVNIWYDAFVLSLLFPFLFYFLAHRHLCSPVNHNELMKLRDLHGFAYDVAIGVAPYLGRSFLEEMIQLLIAGARLAIFQFHDVGIFHVLINVAKGQQEDVGITAVVVEF